MPDALPTVTLIGAAVDRDGSIWLAADAREVASDKLSGHSYDQSAQEKLHERTPQFGWAYHGDTDTGSRFRWHFESIPLENADDLMERSRDALRLLNAGSPITGLVFAGFVAESALLAWIKPSDAVITADQHLFAGNGRVAAEAVWTALGMRLPKMTTRERLVTSMAATMESDTWLGFPLSLWHLKRQGPIDKERLFREDV